MDALPAASLGTLAVAAFSPLEKALMGRDPVFAPGRLAGRLLQRASGGHRSSVPVKVVTGQLMRWIYGPAIGLGWSLARRALPRSRALRIGTLAAGVTAFEMTALPASGATPPLSTWKPVEVALLVAQVVAFSTVIELALS